MNASILEFLLRSFRLKDEVRVGWDLRNVRDPESVADHSWGTALLCLLFASEARVDEAVALRIALVHDLAEAETGDIAAREDPRDRDVSIEEKALLEERAMQALTSGVDRRLREAWDQYETRATPEAIFVRDMNLLDMCLQALYYERENRYSGARRDEGVLDEFFRSADARITTETGRRLFDAVAEEYRRLRSARGQAAAEQAKRDAEAADAAAARGTD